MVVIIHGADTDNHFLATQSSGLWASSAGLAYNITNDYKLLETCKNKNVHRARLKNYFWPFLILILIRKSQKIPKWTKELKAIIQDQIDTNLSLSLQEISEGLQIHPSYVSREFSKYFSNLSFGEYIRKLRIEKATDLLANPDHTLSEIAYLTGFSDQSHFTRIFKAHTGQNPSDFRKSLLKK